MLSLKRRRAGFTLIELLVVVIIIGILASVAMGNLSSAQDKARNSSVLSGTRSVFMAIEGFKADYSGALPLELVGTDPTKHLAANSEGIAGNFTAKYVPGALLPMTPWAKKPQLEVTAPYNNTDGVPQVYSQVKDGQPLDMSKGEFPDGSGEDSAGSGPPPAGSGPKNRLHFGYFYYYSDAPSGNYAVLGVGKAKKLAKVIAVKSNYN